MSAIREAFVIPLLFLTVTLFGGLRIGERVELVTPPLVAVVLGILLVGALVRGGAVAPGLLVSGTRRHIENANGVVVFVTLLAASSQVFNLLIPDTGLLHVLFAAFFLIQILTTIAGVREPRPLLRSVGVMLGGAFVLRFLVLENLYAPGTGTAKRILTLLFEGMSLGAIAYQAHAASTGYVALLALVLYLVGLWLLVPGWNRSGREMVVAHREGDEERRTPETGEAENGDSFFFLRVGGDRLGSSWASHATRRSLVPYLLFPSFLLARAPRHASSSRSGSRPIACMSSARCTALAARRSRSRRSSAWTKPASRRPVSPAASTTHARSTSIPPSSSAGTPARRSRRSRTRAGPDSSSIASTHRSAARHGRKWTRCG